MARPRVLLALRWSFLALVVGAPVSACRKPPPGYYGTVVPRHGPDEVWTNLLSEPEYIDPGKASDSAGGAVITNILAGLTQPHPTTMQPMPELARTWRISEGGRRYTFYLRPSYWSDGRPLTAHDFEYSWKRVLDPATASKYGSFLYPLEHGEAFGQRALWISGLPPATTSQEVEGLFGKRVPIARVQLALDRGWAFVFLGGDPESRAPLRTQALALVDGKSLRGSRLVARVTDSSVVGVRARDDSTLEVRLENPVPYFLSLVMFYTAMPVPRHVIERLAAQGQNTDLWTRPEHIVSNGPYRLVEWTFRQRMVLEKNPRYWAAGEVRIRRVKLAMVEDQNTALNLYRTGYLDQIGENSSLPSEFIEHLRGYQDFHAYPYLAVYFYWINTKAPPLDDRRVRQALSLAIDRESLAKYVTRGGQIPSADIVPDGLAGYRALGSPLFDPDKARGLVEEAGYGPDKKLPRITLTYNTLEGHKHLAQAIQQMWKQHLGIEAEIENQEWKVYLKNLKAKNFQVGRLGWIGDYSDPFTFLDLLSITNGNNHSHWSSPEYDRLLAQANGSEDPAARLELLRQAEALMKAETPLIPIYVYAHSDLWKPYLRGVWGNAQTRQPFKYMWIDERFYHSLPEVPRTDDPPPLLEPEPLAAEATP